MEVIITIECKQIWKLYVNLNLNLLEISNIFITMFFITVVCDIKLSITFSKASEMRKFNRKSVER